MPTPADGATNQFRSGYTRSFPYVDLAVGIKESSTPEYAAVGTFMRVSKFLTYTGRSNRTVALTIRLVHEGYTSASRSQTVADYQSLLNQDVRDVFNGNNLTSGLRDATSSVQACVATVVEPARWLAGLKDSYLGTDGNYHAPPVVTVTVGSLLAMQAVVTACEIVWLPPWYHTEDGGGGEFSGSDAVPGSAVVNMVITDVGG
jgi:hypothetical protein